MSVAAYVRVSSRAQDSASQRAAIEALAKARGETVARWYSEKRSAKTMARPELAKLRESAARGEVSRLYVFRLDRLTRTGIKDTLAVLEELKANGVTVVSVADGFDLTGPCAEVIIAVMAWASQMERLAINERIGAARERLAAEGRPWGKPPSMTRQQVTTAQRMASEGVSVRRIAMALGVTKSTIGRELTRKAS